MSAQTAALPSLALTRPSRTDGASLGLAVLTLSLAGPLAAAASTPGLVTAFWRVALAAAVVGPVLLVRRRGALGRSVRTGVRGALLAGALLAVHFALWIPSLGMTSVASATALVVTQPLWSVCLARLGGHHVPVAAWCGVLVCLGGIVVVTGVDVRASGTALAGDLLALLAGIAAALYTNVAAVSRRSADTLTFIGICYPVSALVLLPICLLSGGSPTAVSGRDWLLLALLAAGPQLLSHTLLNHVARSTNPTVIGLAILVEVPGAALVALAWLGQAPGAGLVPGLALLVGGLALVIGTAPRRASAAAVQP